MSLVNQHGFGVIRQQSGGELRRSRDLCVSVRGTLEKRNGTFGLVITECSNVREYLIIICAHPQAFFQLYFVN